MALARVLGPSGLLTCEVALAEAAAALAVFPVDLFDVVRFGLRLDVLTESQARHLCRPWDDRYHAGRPSDYRGGFDAMLAHRDQVKPLPPLPTDYPPRREVPDARPRPPD